MKGILLCGGFGTRLGPLTNSISKHFLPIFDKPMFFYSLSILLLLRIKHIFIVCDKKDKMRRDLFALFSENDGNKFIKVWKANVVDWKIEEVDEKIKRCFNSK